MHNDEFFMRRAIALSRSAVAHGNEPFGAVLVKDGEIVFENENQIYTRHDPSFHGEAGLIREFCAQTGITDLHEYTMYASCEPCFMCSGALVWVKLGRLVYGASNDDLETILRGKLEGAEQPTLSLHADKSVPIDNVVKVMNIAKDNKWTLILATSPN